MQKLATKTTFLFSFFLALTCQAGALSVHWEAPEPISIEEEVAEALGYFESVDLGALSQRKPLKAAAVLRAAACLERAKRAAFEGERKALEGYMRELAARINVLREGRTESGKDRPFELLNLTSGFDAQVVVEFALSTLPHITVYYGAIPLLSARIWIYASPEEAAGVYYRGDWLFERQEIALGPYKARVARRGYMGARRYDYDPSAHYIYAIRDSRRGYISEVDDPPPSPAGSVMIAPGCSADVERKVKRYLIDEGHAYADVAKKATCILAGPLDHEKIKGHLPELFMTISSLVASRFRVQDGRRVIEVQCPSALAAQRMISAIIKLKPISEEDVELMKREILAEMKSPAGAEGPPNGLGCFVGETHSHTFYSDGNVSPQGLALQAIGVFQDFLVISDHNTIDGALLAGPSLARHGFVYDIIVGEEVTTYSPHFNAYPVKEFISPELSPGAIAQEAHRQGAVVQWNHPGWPESEWAADQYPRILEGTAFDAWEHPHWRYPAWKKAGKAPVIAGSTDTHSGLFYSGERTGIFAPASGGDELAQAIRTRRAVAASWELAGLFMGDDVPTAWAIAALKQGPELREQKIEHLKRIMKDADLAALLEASAADVPAPVVVETLAPVRTGGKARIRVKVADIWNRGGLTAVVELVEDGSSWQAARKEKRLPAGGEDTVVLKSRVGENILPLPSIQVEFRDDSGTFHSYRGQVRVLPESPKGLRAEAESSCQIAISWKKILGCGEIYRIERKTDSTDWQKLGTARPDLMKYFDGELEPDTEYIYRVSAQTSAGGSGHSEEVRAKTPAGPGVGDAAKAATAPETGAETLPRDAFKVWHVGSEETERWPNQAEMALDGNPETFWHTQWGARIPPHPHEFQIDMGKEYSVSGLRYLPRQDGNINGTIGKYRIYVCNDGKQWGDAVARGVWENSRKEKQAYFPPIRGRYVRLVADSEAIGQDWASAAEIYIIGR